MEKLTKNYKFKNAEVNLEDGLIYEYGKTDDEIQTHSLNEVLKELASRGRTNFSINTTTIPTPIED
ncbi:MULTISPECIES: hypothetical protein [Lysinibacillus]|uniref:hypothetical protein n=1 Tax=Lysinibacillus TaxID=400634 RepID=UPI00214AB90D|nr:MULTISPECIES: hypothetical protein [Lysinibacillus]UUV25872.1 hypothetical protein NP781_04450 [Lysinibacillus sp. FN11]UYB48745.1 hypothetical protein OCI51_07240 [Lysinibacillus capsici]